MNQSRSSKILKASLYVMFVVDLFLTASLPFLLDYYMWVLYDAYFLLAGYRTFIIIFLMLFGAIGLWIIAELIGTLRTIDADPFVQKNVSALKRMGFAGLLAALLFFGKCLYYFTPLTFCCGLLLIICSLCAFTLSNLFRQAVAYKEELDLTI